MLGVGVVSPVQGAYGTCIPIYYLIRYKNLLLRSKSVDPFIIICVEVNYNFGLHFLIHSDALINLMFNKGREIRIRSFSFNTINF